MSIHSSKIPNNEGTFIQFGHTYPNISDYLDEYLNFSCTQNDCSLLEDFTFEIISTPMCFYYMNAVNTATQFSLVNFGAENGSVSYLPCNLSSSESVSSLVSEWSKSMPTTDVFQETGMHIAQNVWCPKIFEYLYNTSDHLPSDISKYDLPSNISKYMCHAICNSSVSCFASQLLLASLNTSILQCNDKYSCAFSSITTDSSTASVLCDAEFSCNNAAINVYGNVNTFTLDCVAESSCSDVSLTVYGANTAATVICYKAYACDSLTIYSATDNVNVKLYNYNRFLLIYTPYGYEPDKLDCNPNHAYLSLFGGVYETVTGEKYELVDLAVDELFGGNLPCDSVEYRCYYVNGYCSMTYEYNDTALSVLDYFESYMKCYGPIYIDDILSIRCVGSCPSSPSTPPTAAPTTSPTTPTVSPTAAPTGEPSDAPSNAPTSPPTASPTTPPTQAPTLSPTQSPTNVPTGSPTINPSPGPTTDPTNEPTLDPTPGPTRQPSVSDAYDSYIPVVYALTQFTSKNVLKIISNASLVMNDVRQIIESGIVDDDNVFDDYSNFFLNILSINDFDISDIVEGLEVHLIIADVLELQSRILCAEIYCQGLIKQYTTGFNQQNFEQIVSGRLQIYFANSKVNAAQTKELEFRISSGMDTYSALDRVAESQGLSPVFIFVFVMMGIMLIVSMMALMHNQSSLPFVMPGSSPVDNASWISCFVFSLQVWDFTSDVNLTVELFSRSDLHRTEIFISALGSLAFVVLPYIANLIIAARIKHYIRDNESAKSWFNNHSALFVFLVCISGGAHPSLRLISSNIFGLKLFSSGLTLYELRKLSKLRLLGTVVLENTPQLFCQLLYVSAVGFTDATALAFTASLLSITAASLNYFIDRDDDDTRVTQYYLSTQCDARGDTTLDDIMDACAWDDLDDISAPVLQEAARSTRSTHAGNTVRGGITLNEKQSLIDNRGRTLSLTVDISEVFGIPTKNIEIGASMITKFGLMTHVVHFIYDKDLAEMEDELARHNKTNKRMFVTPKYYVEQLYGACDYEIGQVFRKHFSLNNDFNVKFVRSLVSSKKMALTAISKSDTDKWKKKQTILQKVASSRYSGFPEIPVSDDRDIKDQIEAWMTQRDLDYDNVKERKKFLNAFTAKSTAKKDGDTVKQIEMQRFLASDDAHKLKKKDVKKDKKKDEKHQMHENVRLTSSKNKQHHILVATEESVADLVIQTTTSMIDELDDLDFEEETHQNDDELMGALMDDLFEDENKDGNEAQYDD